MNASCRIRVGIIQEMTDGQWPLLDEPLMERRADEPGAISGDQFLP